MVVLSFVTVIVFKIISRQGYLMCSVIYFILENWDVCVLKVLKWGKCTTLRKGAENTHYNWTLWESCGKKSHVSLYLTTDTFDRAPHTKLWPLLVPHIKKGLVISSSCLQNLHVVQNLRLVANVEWYWGVGKSGIQQCMRKLLSKHQPQVASLGHLEPQCHAKYNTAVLQYIWLWGRGKGASVK